MHTAMAEELGHPSMDGLHQKTAPQPHCLHPSPITPRKLQTGGSSRHGAAVRGSSSRCALLWLLIRSVLSLPAALN